MTKKDGRGRKKSESIQRRLMRMLAVMEEAIENSEWTQYWAINDLVGIAFGDPNGVVTDAKQRKTRYVIGLLREQLKEKYDVEFYSAPRTKHHARGFRLWPTSYLMVGNHATMAKKDAIRMFKSNSRSIVGTLMGPIKTAMDSGGLSLGETNAILEEVQDIRNTFELLELPIYESTNKQN